MDGSRKLLPGNKKKPSSNGSDAGAPIGAHSVPPSKAAKIGVRWNNPLADKTEHTISDSKRSSANSRNESAAVLSEGPDAAAQKIVDALTAGQQGLKAFEKVSFAMAGHQTVALVKAYEGKSGGRSLAQDLIKMFNGNPGPKAGDYLVDALSHGGIPSLRARLWVVFGEVDRSGQIARTLALIPKLGDKIGNAGDEDRVVELFEAATSAERRIAWSDSSLNKKIKGLSSKVHRRIEMLLKVQAAEEKVEQTTSAGANAVADKQALAEARDEQLGEMVRQYLKDIPATGKITPVVGLVDKVAHKVGASKGSEQKWQYMGFDAKKFYDDLVDWKAKASPEDLKQIQQSNSKFNAAFRLIPHNVVMGMTKSEREFITSLSGDTQSRGANATQVKAVEDSLARQKKFVDRGEGTGAWMFSVLTSKIGTRKWRDIATEIKLLSAEQRKEMLDRYDVNPESAMTKLEADLKSAGMDKETRAEILARFNTEFGNIGENYAELWQIVEPGKISQLKTIGGHLKPSKVKKIGDAVSGKARGTAAMKLMFELEDNEFALVRQDRELLKKLQEFSDEKTWAKILDLLGMTSIDDQLNMASSRELVHQARLAGEANPKRFAIQLDKAIGEEIVLSGVSAGRDKAQIYTIADRAQNAAKLKAREDQSEPKVFLNACLEELLKMDRGKDRIEYLQKRVPQAYAAFKENAPIPVKDRFKRAKHEGFGIGSLRKVDREKLQWSFANLTGKQLLDDWSNVDEFLAMKKQVTDTEAEITKATDALNRLTGAQGDSKERQEAQASLATNTGLLADLYGRINTFTIGIKAERRTEFKKIGVNAGDRVQFEAMVSDKLADAMDDDTEVQAFLDTAGLPYDDFMKAKMKGVDALEMQRYLDSTRQWHMFSTKTSELSEATRVVKGGAVSTEQKLAKARTDGKSTDDIANIRKEGAEQTEKAISDRNVVEARFKDMQATFRQRAMVLFKLIVTAIITGVVAAATYGAGTPLAIAIHCALEVGFNALNTMYQYYVLGERNKTKLAIGFALGILESALRILTTNIAAGLNMSLLHPDNIPGTALDWVAPTMLKGMGKVVQGAVMFAPEHIMKQAFHDKDLEKVIKEGEDSMVEDALKTLGKQTEGFMRKMLLGGVKQGLLPELQSAATGQQTAHKAPPQQRSFGQAMTDRMQGGANKEEQEQQWARYQKEKQKDAKSSAMKMLKDGPVTKDTKKAEETAHKDHMKEMRDKLAKTIAAKRVSETMLSTANLLTFRKARGDQFKRLLVTHRISVLDIRSLNDQEAGSVESELHMTPGQIDREITMSAAAESVLRALQPHAAGFSFKLKGLIDSGQLDPNALLGLPQLELDLIAVALGTTGDALANQLRSIASRKSLTDKAKQNPQQPVPPPRPRRVGANRAPVPST